MLILLKSNYIGHSFYIFELIIKYKFNVIKMGLFYEIKYNMISGLLAATASSMV